MYFLNDSHPEYEYTLYTRVGNAKPFLLNRYNSFEDVLSEISSREKRYNRYNEVFYIDNDFYSNHYNINAGGIYLKFLRRRINDWEEFNYNSILENNIVYFNKKY